MEHTETKKQNDFKKKIPLFHAIAHPSHFTFSIYHQTSSPPKFISPNSGHCKISDKRYSTKVKKNTSPFDFSLYDTAPIDRPSYNTYRFKVVFIQQSGFKSMFNGQTCNLSPIVNKSQRIRNNTSNFIHSNPNISLEFS